MTGPSWNRFVGWWHRNYRTEGNYTEDEKVEQGYQITRYFENETWENILTMSYGLTKFIHPDEDVNYRQLNYLILQTCQYYKHYDSRHWISPLLTALGDNKELPTTTEGKTISPVKAGQTSNYDIIDNMGDFGMARFSTMEKLWKEIQRTTTIELTSLDLRTTKEGLRSDDIRPKSSRSKL